ncbi:hypothetical protein GC170_16915 [bacterium]|nr:hypothetical protein [bacterium]
MITRLGFRHSILKTIAFAALSFGTIDFRLAEADDKKAAQTADPLEGEKKADDKKESSPALGLWELEYDNQGTQVIDRYEIKAGEKGELTGKLLRGDKEITKLEKVKIEGDKLSFEASGTTDGVTWKAELSGKVAGDAIDGTAKITVNDQSFDLPWQPKRVKQGK